MRQKSLGKQAEKLSNPTQKFRGNPYQKIGSNKRQNIRTQKEKENNGPLDQRIHFINISTMKEHSGNLEQTKAHIYEV